MIKKLLIILIIFLIFVVGGYFIINYGTNIPELVKKQQEQENKPTYQEKLNSITIEDCKNTYEMLPEAKDRCRQVWKMSPLPLIVDTQEKKDKLIKKLEKTFLFYGVDGINFTIREGMLTPEALQNCAKIWKDMVHVTSKIRTGDPRTIGNAMEIQTEFRGSGCAATQNDWKNN